MTYDEMQRLIEVFMGIPDGSTHDEIGEVAAEIKRCFPTATNADVATATELAALG